MRDFGWIDWDQLVFLVPVPDKLSPPVSACRILFPKETETTVGLCIDFAPINSESLRDGCLHFGHRSLCIWSDVGGRAVDSVHDECAFVHARLGGFEEVQMVCFPGPCGVYVSIWMENRLEVFPLACIANNIQVRLAVLFRSSLFAPMIFYRRTDTWAIPRPTLVTCSALEQGYQGRYFVLHARAVSLLEENEDQPCCKSKVQCPVV